MRQPLAFFAVMLFLTALLFAAVLGILGLSFRPPWWK